MKLADQYTLPASPDAVWAALNDPAVLQATLPGCRSLAMLDERHFESTLQVRVGPAVATFRGNVELLDLEPPRAYTIVGYGNAGPAGFARVTARVRLEALDEATTALHYDADVEIGGKLMSVGARLIQSAAAKNLDAFFGALRAHVEQMSGNDAGIGSSVESQHAARVQDTQEGTARAAAASLPPASSAGAPARSSNAARASFPSRGWPVWAIGAVAGAAGLLIGFLAGHLT